MSTALYRRYRSARFADLIGQEHVAQTLLNEVRSGQLAHAYLFAGIRGTGKTSTARILARAVNCLDLQDGEPCNVCAACTEILGGGAVDVLEIDAASNRGIDEMRDLRDKVKFLPASLRRKVYIIDEAHMLTTEAWNAFLKTLEEPPPHVLFVLATTEPHKVPDTVRSRVQRFDFRRVDRAAIARHLGRIALAEEAAVDEDALDLVARAGQGSVRDALSLLDQALASGERPVSVVTVRRALGLADPAVVRSLLVALASADPAGALRAVAAAFDAGADARQLLRESARLARAAELLAIGYPEGAELGEDDEAVCRELATVARGGFWVDALDRFAEAEANLRMPVDARLTVELCVLRLTHGAAGQDSDLSALAERVAALEAAVRDGGTVTAPRTATAPGRNAAAPAPLEKTAAAPPETTAGTAPREKTAAAPPEATAGAAPPERTAAPPPETTAAVAPPEKTAAALPENSAAAAPPEKAAPADPARNPAAAAPPETTAAVAPLEKTAAALPENSAAAAPAEQAAAADPARSPAAAAPPEKTPAAASPSSPATAAATPAAPPAAPTPAPTPPPAADLPPPEPVRHIDPSPAPPPPTPMGAGPATPADWTARWPALIEVVNRRDRMLAGVLRDCRAVESTPGRLVVGVPFGFHEEQLRNRLAKLVESVAEFAGEPTAVEILFVGAGAQKPSDGDASAPPAPATSEPPADTAQTVLATFPGSRITGSRLRDHAHD